MVNLSSFLRARAMSSSASASSIAIGFSRKTCFPAASQSRGLRPAEYRLLSPDLEQTGSVASHYPFLLDRGEPRHAVDQADRVFLAHVEGIVGAEQHLRRAELVDQVAQHLGVERDRVEKELLEIARRGLLDHGPAIGPRPPGV